MRELDVDAENLLAGITLNIDDLARGLGHEELDGGVAADAFCSQVLRLSGFNDGGTHRGATREERGRERAQGERG